MADANTLSETKLAERAPILALEMQRQSQAPVSQQSQACSVSCSIAVAGLQWLACTSLASTGSAISIGAMTAPAGTAYTNIATQQKNVRNLETDMSSNEIIRQVYPRRNGYGQA